MPDDPPPRRTPRITIQAPPAPTYTLGPQTIPLPFPLSLEVLDRLLFRASIERTGSGRPAAKLLGRSEGWAAARCFELDIPATSGDPCPATACRLTSPSNCLAAPWRPAR